MLDETTRPAVRGSDYLNKSDPPPTLLEPHDMDALTVRRPLALQATLPLAAAASAADQAAANHLFTRYRSRLAEETLRRHDADLALFTLFLQDAGIDVPAHLHEAPGGWAQVSWGLVHAFVEWQLQQGYAIGSINVRLSTIKSYAKRAAQAGALSGEAYAQIKLVTGMRHREGKRVDEQREQTRTGTKKAEPVSITSVHAAQLKAHPDLQRRMAFCLLLDHGLRVGELVTLRTDDIDLRTGQMRFYRSKVDLFQIHELSDDALSAADAYLPALASDAPLFPVDRTVRTWVRDAGAALGIAGLSPHDLRHYWATAAIAGGTDLKSLQDAGGWASPAMPLRYAASAAVANDGVRLGDVHRRGRRPRG